MGHLDVKHAQQKKKNYNTWKNMTKEEIHQKAAQTQPEHNKHQDCHDFSFFFS